VVYKLVKDQMSKQCIKRSIDELNTHAINLKAVAMLCGSGSGMDRGVGGVALTGLDHRQVNSVKSIN